MTTPTRGDDHRRDDRLFIRERKKTTIDPETRSEFERDVDRIYYSYYFRRLAEVTQVSTDYGPLLHHNRMTHSLKVAQVGRRLVQYLKHDPTNDSGIEAAHGIDEDVVTAAGLLHDAGHPPYGHIGEKALDKLAKDNHLSDGYEGNAQTLRIIMNLVAHTAQDPDKEVAYGLNLTRAVVAACVKYPWPEKHPNTVELGNKWGYYKPEEHLFDEFVAPTLPAPNTATLEAKLMDWADDITYAVHDLQDFHMSGIIPLHHLRHTRAGPVNHGEFREFWRYLTEKLRKDDDQSLDKAHALFGRYAQMFPERPFDGGREKISQVGALASRIITEASRATQILPDGALHIEPGMRVFINALKQLTWFYVIDHPDLVSTQLGQKARINQMFDKLLSWVRDCFKERENGRQLTSDETWIMRRRLPTELREFTEQLLGAHGGRGAYDTAEACYARAVIDYIASMTEVEFCRMHAQLCTA